MILERDYQTIRASLPSKALHIKRAKACARLARILKSAWNRNVSSGIEFFGPHDASSPYLYVSGCYSDRWPEPIKDALRCMAHSSTRYKDLARAHCRAAGLRTAGTRRICS